MGRSRSPERRRQFVARVLERLQGMPAIESLGAVASSPITGSSSNPADLSRGRGTHAAGRPPRRLSACDPGLLRDPADSPARRTRAERRRPRRWPAGRGRQPQFRRSLLAGSVTIGRPLQNCARRALAGGRGGLGRHPARLVHEPAPAHLLPASRAGRGVDARLRRAHVTATRLAWPANCGEPSRRPIRTSPFCSWRRWTRSWPIRSAAINYLAKALAAMGGIALVLALMGIYSLVAYLASRRTQEIGVSIALGATRWQVIRLNVHAGARHHRPRADVGPRWPSCSAA